MYHPTEITRYFRVARNELAYLKFIVEAHEGLATLSTADRKTSTVSITYDSHFAEDIDALLKSLGTEIALKEVPNMEFHSHA
ncbi:DUF4911 domain-containing protein [Geobacter benzoatilyticus]|uniref:DUF4911 domain-containing protein n=1 Tax=Geobacter benzoatilyticus TaxID=2815309 RepID=A0ABX7PZB7_9BACT|nr:DUF4911 domain-containing protein [Geobacter benzoatilyticus]QSV44484.1 DUF4911 domain-containing protein [Geobacter benzoatilyticus]